MTAPEIARLLAGLPERAPVATADIIAVLRREAQAEYIGVTCRHGTCSRCDARHDFADVLRRAAKRLARLEDDALAAVVAAAYFSWGGEEGDAIDAYRAAIRGRP